MTKITGAKSPYYTGVNNDGILRFQGRVCIPDDVEVKRLILEERHKSRLSLHPGMTKMY